ncbi:DNA binding protein [Phytophthora cinnamomi]|uniref:DNA binding protein n=1 Tax=Phytophthora cinnamomi TaxID=4785 RepID=UPI0035595E3B|nr:DNA binding protein [Phytophthora cinnamomi]
MAMAADHELTAVCQFLNELSLDEIYRLQLATTNDDDDITPTKLEPSMSDDDGTDASTVTGVTSDEGSDVEDPPRPGGATSSKKRAASETVTTASPTKKKRLPKNELQRARQRMYDQKSRYKKQMSHKALCQAFVPALKLFILLMEKRVEQTERRIQLLRVVNESDAALGHNEQLPVNEEAIEAIDKWTSKWSYKREKHRGKFFMREQAMEIEPEMKKLADVGKRLSLVTAELKWRLGGEAISVVL